MFGLFESGSFTQVLLYPNLEYIQNISFEENCFICHSCSSQSSMYISVPKPPKVDFTRVPKEIIVKKGEKIEIDVPFVGTPRPDAEWARDGKPLSDRDTDIETKDKNSKLCIPHSERTDAGLYELTLTNEVGTEKVPVNVIVKGTTKIVFLFFLTRNGPSVIFKK